MDQIDAVAAATPRPFGVNVFVPAPRPADPDAVSAYLQELEAEALPGRRGRRAAVRGRRLGAQTRSRLRPRSGGRVVHVRVPEAAVVARLHGRGGRGMGDGHRRRARPSRLETRAPTRWSSRAARRAATAAASTTWTSGGTGLLALLRLVAAARVAADGRGRRDRRRGRRGRGPVRGRERRPDRDRADARARGRHARGTARAAGRVARPRG